MNVTERFSDRVENYIKYRPDYPKEIIPLLEREINFSSEKIIADIGSGTGILTEIFLRNGNKVFAVEPNQPMRIAAEKLLAHYENYSSINATAEETTLENSSVDIITAAQAFHWFDKEKFSSECRRILRENGYVILIWNERKTDSTQFLREYEQLLLAYATDYTEVNHKNITDQEIEKFFFGNVKKFSLENFQFFDFEGVKGRLLSSSYAPNEQHKNFLPMMQRLEEIFSSNKEFGKVKFEYETNIFIGQLR